MAATTVWVCDGPKCREICDREKGERFPAVWERIILHSPDHAPASGSFHDAQCAHAWLDQKLGLGD